MVYTIQAEYQQAKEHLLQFERVIGPQLIAHIHQEFARRYHQNPGDHHAQLELRGKPVRIKGAHRTDHGEFLWRLERNTHKGGLFTSPWKPIMYIGLIHDKGSANSWTLDVIIKGDPRKDIYYDMLHTVMYKEQFIQKVAAHFGINLHMHMVHGEGQIFRDVSRAAHEEELELDHQPKAA